MRGFLVGSLLLIGLDVLVQPGAADRAASGLDISNSLFNRILSPNTAGIPQKK
jgi:hypothetical protein